VRPTASQFVLPQPVDAEFTITCPQCDRMLFVCVVEDALEVSAEDPVFHRSTPTTPVQPQSTGSLPPDPSSDAAWLTAMVENLPGLAFLRDRLPVFFGQVSCPACANKVGPLFDRLMAEVT
jgi:ribosomal protein S27E